MKSVPVQSYVALVDDEDFEKVRHYRWQPLIWSHGVYALAVTSRKLGRRKSILMHRLILGVRDRTVRVDHHNHNGLDNQKRNLRICTQRHNRMNSHPWYKRSNLPKGVRSRGDRWTARIMKDGKGIHLGTFDTVVEASTAYDVAARKLFASFAYTNADIKRDLKGQSEKLTAPDNKPN